MKLTDRQRYLLGTAKPPHSMWRVTAGGYSSIIKPYVYQDPNRQPSKAELAKLTALGLIELRVDPDTYTKDTRTGKRTPHHRVELTAAGLKAIEPAPAPLTADDIRVGKLYRGKRRRESFGRYDDRSVLHIDARRERVQYDSYFVGNGRRYPTTTMECFLKWALCEVPQDAE